MRKIIIFVVLILVITLGSKIYYDIKKQLPKGLKGKIIFEGTVDSVKGERNIVGIFNLETAEETTFPIKGSSVKLSPDASQILYSEDHDIYIVSSNGINKKKILGDGEKKYQYGHPAWSPEGDKIIFLKYGEGKDILSIEKGIYVIELQSKKITKIINDELDPRYPIFSPDGQKIAFIGYYPNDIELGIIKPRIFTANSNGSDIRQVGDITTLHFDWSPDGTKFCYISEIDNQIHIVNADGTNDKVITNLKSYGWSCSWSPDGTKIIFDYIPPPFAQTPREIYIINTDGTCLTRFYPKGNWSSISRPQWWGLKEDKK